MTTDTDARELALFAVNDGDLYRQRIQPILANLRRKIKRGIYDHTLALKLWRYAADDAAKRYSREFGPCQFSTASRQNCAVEMQEHYDEELRQA